MLPTSKPSISASKDASNLPSAHHCHKGLLPESQRYIARFGCYYDHDLNPDKMVEMLIRAEKGNASDFITAFSDYLRQVRFRPNLDFLIIILFLPFLIWN